MTTWQKRLRVWLVCAVALLALGSPVRGALAHADIESSEPPADGVVTEAPTQVRIYFTQDLFRRVGMNRIEVYDAADVRVDQDAPVIDDDNRRQLTVSLQPNLAAGQYTVRWFSLSSEDGHDGAGEFTFTVEATAAISDTAAVTTTDEVTATSALTTTEVLTETAPTETAPAEVATVEPTAPAEPTVTEPPATAEPTPTPDAPSGLTCFGAALPFGLVLGPLWLRRRRTA